MRSLALLACACLASAAEVAVEAPWSRATAPGAPAGAVFCTLAGGDQDDRLVGARCAVAETVELHTHARGADGVMRMRPVEAIPVPAHGRVELRPGAEHIMLIGLVRPLAAGETLPVSLRFARAGEVAVLARVGMAGADAPPAAAPATPACCSH